MSKEKPWWFPELVGPELANRLRNDYPNQAHMADDEILSFYDYDKKYAIMWDNLGDAYSSYETLADAYLALLQKNKEGVSHEG